MSVSSVVLYWGPRVIGSNVMVLWMQFSFNVKVSGVAAGFKMIRRSSAEILTVAHCANGQIPTLTRAVRLRISFALIETVEPVGRWYWRYFYSVPGQSQV